MEFKKIFLGSVVEEVEIQGMRNGIQYFKKAKKERNTYIKQVV